MSGFDDTVDIGATLVAPKDHGEELTATVGEIGGNLGTIDDAWQWFFGWSLPEYLFVPLSGDWGQLRSFSEGWDALGDAAEGVSTNLSEFTTELGQSWQGVAADVFNSYMGTRWRARRTCARTCSCWSRLLKARKAGKVLKEFISVIETVIDYVMAVANAIEEINDNQPVPSGDVAAPDAPDTSDKESRGEPRPVP